MQKQSKYAAKGGPFPYSTDLKRLAKLAREGEADSEEYRELDAAWRQRFGVPARNAPFIAVAEVEPVGDEFEMEDMA